jgi:hypothetical protein
MLKKLRLFGPHIKIHEIEYIHCNIPSIQDFSLIHGIHLDGSMSYNVLPATCITNFEFKAMRHADVETCAQMYRYMIKKYTNINKMEHYDGGLRYYNTGQRRYVYFNWILSILFFKKKCIKRITKKKLEYIFFIVQRINNFPNKTIFSLSQKTMKKKKKGNNKFGKSNDIYQYLYLG